MVKVSAPLFSFGARGQLGQALVFFPWKGIDAARQYVIPANPKSTAQSVQRGYMTDAVDAWHAADPINLLAVDLEAWNRYAGTLGPMSGFNAFCRSWINEQVAGGTPLGSARTFSVTDDSHDSLDLSIQFSGYNTQDATMHIGTSKTFFPVSDTAAMVGGFYTAAAFDTGYGAGQKVYVWFEAGTPGSNWARSGLYTIDLT